MVLEYPQRGRLLTFPGQTDTAVLVGLEALKSMGTDWKTPVSVSSPHTAAELCCAITSAASVSCQMHIGCKSHSDVGAGTGTAGQGPLTPNVRVAIWSFSG